jgi:Cu/Ag efflux protein CusF
MFIKRVIPVLVATAVAGSAFAAAALSTTGVIKSIDTAKKDIVLQSGDTFGLPAKFDAAKLKVGEKVKIFYEKKGSQMVASKVEAMK